MGREVVDEFVLLLQRVFFAAVAVGAHVLSIQRLHLEELGLHLGEVDGPVLVEDRDTTGEGRGFGVSSEAVPWVVRGHLEAVIRPCSVGRAFAGCPRIEGGALAALPRARTHQE